MLFKPEIKLELADDRGEIYSISLPEGEFMLLHSKEGTLRGGHSHDVYEMALVLAGRMIHLKPGRSPLELLPGQMSQNEPHAAHMGEFPEDTWLIDFKPGTPAHTSVDTDYEPMRKMVRDASSSNRQ